MKRGIKRKILDVSTCEEGGKEETRKRARIDISDIGRTSYGKIKRFVRFNLCIIIFSVISLILDFICILSGFAVLN